MSQMQKDHNSVNSQNHRQSATWGRSDSMRQVRSNDGCPDWRQPMIVVLMGAPGAGKSTWVARNKTANDYIYNTEAVRVNRELDIAAFMSIQRRKAISAVEQGKDLIADGTHTISTHRQVWLNLADRLNHKTKLVVFDTSLQACLAVQKQREFPAPGKVVIDHHKRLQSAKLHIKREGWGSIEIITR
jgi:predicted kinase